MSVHEMKKDRVPTVARLKAVRRIVSSRTNLGVFIVSTILMFGLLVLVELVAVALVGTVSNWAWPSRIRLSVLPFSMAGFGRAAALDVIDFPFLVAVMTFGDDVGALIAEVSLYSALPMAVMALLGGVASAVAWANLKTGRLLRQDKARVTGGLCASVGTVSMTTQAFSILGGCCGGSIPAAAATALGAASASGGAVSAVGLVGGILAFVTQVGQVGMVLGPLFLLGVVYYLGGVSVRLHREMDLAKVAPAGHGVPQKGHRFAVLALTCAVALATVVLMTRVIDNRWWPDSQARPHQLTRFRARSVNPSWSPVADKIAFVSFRTGAYELWLSDVSGGALEQLTDNRLHKSNPSWSPDGRQIAFVQSTQGERQIWIFDLATRSFRQVTYDVGFKNSAVWSPGGSEIAYIRQDLGVSELWVTDLRTGVSRKLAALPGIINHPTWRPDGAAVAFTGTIQGKSEIWQVDLAGGPPRQISQGPGNKMSPAWSPVGRRIAFISDLGGDPKAWVMDADGRNPRVLMGAETGVYEISWDPRGRRVAYVKVDRLTENASIWISSVD